MTAALRQVLQHPGIWRGNDVSRVELPSVPTGFPRLDAELPGSGWPRGALTEIAFEGEGIGELSLLAPALAALSRDEPWIVLVDPPHLPYAPALARAGVDLSRLVLVRGGQTLWAAETALRSGSCAAVLAWPGTVDGRELRKLQLAAEAGRSWGVYLLPASASPSTSPAALRLRLAPATHGCDPAAGEGETVRVHIVKRRGGPTAPFALSLHRLR